MRRVIIGGLVFGFCVIVPVSANAQAPVPHTESTAIGLDVGAVVPSSDQGDQLDNAPVINGLIEYYLTPRVSLRGAAGWSQPSLKGSSIDKVREIPIRLDVHYNWERGKWHPFIGTGFSAYFTQYKRRGEPLGDSDTKLGVNAGGGIEYFLNRTVAVKSEGNYHKIGDLGRIDPSGMAFTAGLKTYF